MSKHDPSRRLRARLAVLQSRLEQIALEIVDAPPAKTLERRLERQQLAEEVVTLKRSLADAEDDPRQLRLALDERREDA